MNYNSKQLILYSIAIFAVLYLGTYLSHRASNIQYSDANGKNYLIFPEDRKAYYIFRPLTILDGIFTDMNFHIGRHE